MARGMGTNLHCVVGGQRLAYPSPSSSAVTRVMKSNRKVDTKPEVLIRSSLHACGMRFRKNYELRLAALRVRPDIVFTRRKVAVFVDGCFWHGCPEHGTRPRVNQAYWDPKLERNRRRDCAVDSALRDAGWRVIRLWEHVPICDAVAAVRAAYREGATVDSARSA